MAMKQLQKCGPTLGSDRLPESFREALKAPNFQTNPIALHLHESLFTMVAEARSAMLAERVPMAEHNLPVAGLASGSMVTAAVIQPSGGVPQ